MSRRDKIAQFAREVKVSLCLKDSCRHYDYMKELILRAKLIGYFE